MNRISVLMEEKDLLSRLYTLQVVNPTGLLEEITKNPQDSKRKQPQLNHLLIDNHMVLVRRLHLNHMDHQRIITYLVKRSEADLTQGHILVFHQLKSMHHQEERAVLLSVKVFCFNLLNFLFVILNYGRYVSSNF